MKTGMRALLVLAATVVASPRLAAHTPEVVGRVVDIHPETSFVDRHEDARPETLVIKMKGRREIAVSLNARTRYVRWVTRQPWQQSTRADPSSLRPGRLVAVEVGGTDDHPVARVVRIATE